MKIIRRAAAAAATAVVAGAVAMGGTANAVPVSATHTMADAARAADTVHSAMTAATASGWGKAHPVPGLATLNAGHSAGVSQVSCASPGNCAATGTYTDAQDHDQALVADEKNGTWGQAIEVPGTGALNGGSRAETLSISCPSAGNCATGGQLNTQTAPVAYVADERAGGWDLAQQVFGGTGAFNTAVDADAESVSCGSLGNCAAGGSYITPGNVRLAFVVNEVNGSWGNAHNMPGIAPLATGRLSAVTSVSCASPGNCAAGGFYRNAHGDQAFVADQSTTAGNAIPER